MEGDKKNYITVEPGTISLIYTHLASQEIDSGLNASFKDGTVKYYVNQDNPNDKNAQFSIIDENFIFTYFPEPGQSLTFGLIGNTPEFIGTNLTSPDQIRQALSFNLETKFFDFIKKDFKKLRPSEIIGELLSYFRGHQISFPVLTKFAYPTALLANLFNTPHNKTGFYHDILSNRTFVHEQGVETPCNLNNLPEELETAIKISLEELYNDRYKFLPEDSPEKTTQPELAQRVFRTVKDIITRPSPRPDITDCLYFFKILDQKCRDIKLELQFP